MPGRRLLRGASAKEQRQYEHIVESAKDEGRYGKRAKEVAARTVMKQHAAEGHEPHRTAAPARPRTTARKPATPARAASGRKPNTRTRK